ncbi:hypothetical protein [Streptomyces sp. V1I1]|uniref:hypothetical protein n=1 Tax=Streptomyces sp. V1I1 TaxID=3042272 RepID=UPI00277EE889|nr:hypothetical protein [Streptomyces sp. V1I1]MDQ0943158.1 hypothetical protein [Streptomyces sp. V1I1]
MKLAPPFLTKLPLDRAYKELKIFLYAGYGVALFALFVSASFATVALICSVRPLAISVLHPGVKRAKNGRRYLMASVALALISVLELLIYANAQ